MCFIKNEIYYKDIKCSYTNTNQQVLIKLITDNHFDELEDGTFLGKVSSITALLGTVNDPFSACVLCIFQTVPSKASGKRYSKNKQWL